MAGAGAGRASTRRAFGQVLFCKGCCCGRTDRGLPELPSDWIKGVWKAEKLNRAIQLTISGCLGPCDLPNVAAVLLGDRMLWFGNLTERAHYLLFVDWARRCHAAGGLAPLPHALAEFAFDRLAPAPAPGARAGDDGPGREQRCASW